MQSDVLVRNGSGAITSQRPVAVSKVVESAQDRDGKWVMRFGRGLCVAVLLSGTLWGAIVVVIRLFS